MSTLSVGPCSHLTLLEVVAHNRNAVAAEEILIHELADGLHIGAQADAHEAQVRGSRAKVAALQVARRHHLALYVNPCRRSVYPTEP